MRTFRPVPPSTAWLLVGLIALALLLTDALLPQWLSGGIFAVALSAYLWSGTRRTRTDTADDA
ncbi:hypothetical protein SAMN04487783_1112 [Agrococcus baldri]|uniref:Uncharacterized protein n=1 Tax=Agrococcus baldri TaxID=153730 RepID=A0AA94HLV6_9MICO|nr:hypothetical protein [Agrococcus baldri]SFS08518.1 hypothetical protein SAMN04487783_1112 [Agrococcus baldri]